jgi:hypothetical protein
MRALRILKKITQSSIANFPFKYNAKLVKKAAAKVLSFCSRNCIENLRNRFEYKMKNKKREEKNFFTQIGKKRVNEFEV